MINCYDSQLIELLFDWVVLRGRLLVEWWFKIEQTLHLAKFYDFASVELMWILQIISSWFIYDSINNKELGIFSFFLCFSCVSHLVICLRIINSYVWDIW